MVAELVLLSDLGLIVLAGTLFAFVFRQLKQPLIAGYIVAGLILGPLVLGVVSDFQTISALSELGVAFLLFGIGMEIDFSKLWEFKRTIVIGGILQVILTAVLVSGLMQFFGLALVESLYIGFIVAFSSTVIVVKILTDQKQLNSLEGKLIVGYALVQDLIAVLVLPVLANPAALTDPALFAGILLNLLFLFVLAWVLSRFVFPVITGAAAGTGELFYLTIMASFFVFAETSILLNFSLAASAFVGGLALGRIRFNLEAQSIIRNVRDLFATVFFVSLGLQLTLIPASANWLILGVMLAVVFVLNPLIFALINLYAGFGLRASIFIGFALAQASEFSFILASQGFKLGHITEPVYNLAVGTILISMIATPYMMKYSDSFARFLLRFIPMHNRFFERRLSTLEQLPEREMSGHIVVAGAGMFGSNLAFGLAEQAPVVVVDSDPQVVAHLNKNGMAAVYASRYNHEVWEKLNLQKARLIVVTVPHAKTAIELVRMFKKFAPQTPIVGRAHYYSEALDLYSAGVDFVAMPQVMASNYTISIIRDFLTTGKKPKPSLLEQEYLKVLREKTSDEGR
ncbi:MAG: cation:proton antiporter [Candidatus Micrarchaeota archaeon]